MSFARNIGKHICKNISSRCSHAKQSATDAFKTASKRATQKLVDATGAIIGNKFTTNFTTEYLS